MSAAGRAGISGLGVGVIAAGGVLIMAGITGAPVVDTLRSILSGKLPTVSPASAKGGDSPAVSAAAAHLADVGGAASAVQTGSSGGGSSGLAGAALKYLGVPYRWGGESRSGMDCSGLVQRAFADIGVKAPRTTYTQQAWSRLHRISASSARAGDLVFWPGHVAVYLGGGQVVHAPRPGRVVSKAPVSSAGPPGTSPSYYRYVGASERTVAV